ncbi:hypothetical protein L210DRAFT_3020504 [Boletus edulis BED1]|uniref:Uncharacterized protein n=1 Tax=Boletus edulis BED1 TaxID=1328754 RepID=A0AAD4G8R7_BOLED|nr:hypothetical protein L210DRAFT_3020504 [Boletus edulis BED1]
MTHRTPSSISVGNPGPILSPLLNATQCSVLFPWPTDNTVRVHLHCLRACRNHRDKPLQGRQREIRLCLGSATRTTTSTRQWHNIRCLRWRQFHFHLHRHLVHENYTTSGISTRHCTSSRSIRTRDATSWYGRPYWHVRPATYQAPLSPRQALGRTRLPHRRPLMRCLHHKLKDPQHGAARADFSGRVCAAAFPSGSPAAWSIYTTTVYWSKSASPR